MWQVLLKISAYIRVLTTYNGVVTQVTIDPAIPALIEYNFGSPSFHLRPPNPTYPYSVLKVFLICYIDKSSHN